MTILQELQLEEKQKPRVSFDAKFMGDYIGSHKLLQSIQKKMSAEFQTVLEESNYFSEVGKELVDADIELDVEFVTAGNPAAIIPAFITGFSFYTIPSWAKEKYSLTVKAVLSGGMSKEYSLMDSTTLVQWLPMIFVFPKHNFSVIPKVRQNMYRRILFDMNTDGFFEPGISSRASQPD